MCLMPTWITNSHPKPKTLSTTGRLDSKGTSRQEPCSHDHHPPPIRLCSQDNLVRTESATFTGPPAASPHLERAESSTVKLGGWHSQHPTGQPFRDPQRASMSTYRTRA